MLNSISSHSSSSSSSTSTNNWWQTCEVSAISASVWLVLVLELAVSPRAELSNLGQSQPDLDLDLDLGWAKQYIRILNRPQGDNVKHCVLVFGTITYIMAGMGAKVIYSSDRKTKCLLFISWVDSTREDTRFIYLSISSSVCCYLYRSSNILSWMTAGLWRSTCRLLHYL